MRHMRRLAFLLLLLLLVSKAVPAQRDPAVYQQAANMMLDLMYQLHDELNTTGGIKYSRYQQLTRDIKDSFHDFMVLCVDNRWQESHQKSYSLINDAEVYYVTCGKAWTDSLYQHTSAAVVDPILQKYWGKAHYCLIEARAAVKNGR